MSTLVPLLLLAAVLVTAITRPRGLPEWVVAVPAAVIVVVTGLVPAYEAWATARELAPTVAFLAFALALAHLCAAEGLFVAIGCALAGRAGGNGVVLLQAVFVVAAVTTAVFSLDTTVVLLTPVVLAMAARSGRPATPYVYATAHLANSASLLLPVSNLTNLLALRSSGLGFGRFAALMALPWLVCVGIDYVVFRVRYRRVLAEPGEHEQAPATTRIPRFALGVVIATLVGFVVTSPLGIEPFWVAGAAVVVLGAARLVRASPRTRPLEARRLVRSANVGFCAFVIALGIVVQAVLDHGLGALLATWAPKGSSLTALLGFCLLGAIAANVVNNLPAVLILLPLAAAAGPVAVLAVLIGVNVGPNLTYVGSLATLLWRRILAHHGERVRVGEFTLLGALSVPMSLVAGTLALWASAALLRV